MTMRETYFTNAISEAIDHAMATDPSVIILGEDVKTGPIGGTKGLFDKYGPDRVRNTPITEQTIVGSCVGAAASGLRPVADIMFASFFYVAMDQLGNQAARLRYMSGGQIELPIVYMSGAGPAGSLAAQHSENPHPLIMQLAGLKLVVPSTPADAKGLMLASIRDPNPVVYLIDLVLTGKKGPVPEEPYEIPLGSADVKRLGSDVTVVAIGSLVGVALDVADELEADGIAVEVVDPRSLVPLDWPTIAASIAKTGRLVVADPARRSCGAAAEIVSRALETNWDDLKSRPRRVTWADVPMPFSPPLETAAIVTHDDIRAAVNETLGTAPTPALPASGRGR
jgi:pyruvate/2-oxoglutarate/acetoin dehydrogenase E1 component